MSSDTSIPMDGDSRKERPLDNTRRRKTDPGDDGQLDHIELVLLVIDLIAQGVRATDVVAAVKKQYPNQRMSREDPYSLLQEAGEKGWVAVKPPLHLKWTVELRDRYTWLRGAEVVHTSVPGQIARAGARALVKLLKDLRRDLGKREVHIGISGGHSMRALARAFAEELAEPTDGLPETIVIHAMAAGFDPQDPTTDPNTFCLHFAPWSVNDVKVEFHGLAAPSLVKPEDIPALRRLPDIAAAFEAVALLDVIVASGSCWDDRHGALRNLMARSPESLRVLEEEACVADLLWRPLSDRGPIEKATNYRALTLVELSGLPGLVRAGKRVLVTLGPCGACFAPKGRLLLCLLKQRWPLMSDLVVDSRTMAQMKRLQARTTDH